MSDPDRLRPALPDPQQDRHVSFPDEAPDEASRTKRRAVPPTCLERGAAPAAATVGPGPAARGLGAPADQPGPRGARDDSMVGHRCRRRSTTPPARPAPRRRRSRWAAARAADARSRPRPTGTSTTEGCPSYTGAGPGMSDCGPWGGTGDGGVGPPADSGSGRLGPGRHRHHDLRPAARWHAEGVARAGRCRSASGRDRVGHRPCHDGGRRGPGRHDRRGLPRSTHGSEARRTRSRCILTSTRRA